MGVTKRRRAEIAYDKVKDWIHKIVRDFQRQKGGDFNELLAEANFIFAISILEYDKRRSSLTYYTRRKIWHGLIDYQKKRWRHKIEAIDELPEVTFARRQKFWFLPDLLDEIGRDARLVVECLLNPDWRLMVEMDGRDGFNIERRAIREYLVEYRHWTHNRVDYAFCELQSALRR